MCTELELRRQQERNKQRELIITRYIQGVTPGSLLDIGVGCKSEWRTLKEVWPSMEVYGVEPNPATFERLLASVFPGTLLCCAIAADRTMPLHVFPETAPANERGSASRFPVAGHASVITVPAIRLDELVALVRPKPPILLWMDCEGGELEAISTGDRLMASGDVAWINIETRPEPDMPGWPSEAIILHHLKYWGFHKVATYPEGDEHKHHDLILARNS
jgi:FkbM family methyltransferase